MLSQNTEKRLGIYSKRRRGCHREKAAGDYTSGSNSSRKAISIIRLSAKGTDGVMKRRCFRLKLMFAILFTGVLGILQRPWR